MFAAELEERQRALRRRKQQRRSEAAEVGASSPVSEGTAWQN
jgi:hypothetical protein